MTTALRSRVDHASPISRRNFLLAARALVALLMMLLLFRPAVAADFARSFGGPGADARILATTVDSAGNSYIAGYFTSGPLVSGVVLAPMGTQDAFVAKINASGGVLWARNFGGAGATAQFTSIAVDSSSSVYVGGNFGNANLTTPNIIRIGATDGLMIRLDANGNVTLATRLGGALATMQVNGVAVDAIGNAYLTGSFLGASLTTPVLGKIGAQDAFVIRVNSLGSVVLSRNFGGATASVTGTGIAVDSAFNVYVSGTLTGGNLTSPSMSKIGPQDMMLLKVDIGGSVIGARNYGGATATASGNAIALDSAGNAYLAGQFSGGNLTVPPLSRTGSTDGIVIKLDGSGNTLWASDFGGLGGADVFGNSVAVDSAGNAYLAGYFRSASLTALGLVLQGTDDAYVFKLSSASGAVSWAANYVTSASVAHGNSISVDSQGTTYLAGYFSGATVFGQWPGSTVLTKIGATDAFLIKQSTTPDPPASVTATAGDAQAQVFFGAPTITGGAPIVSYTVTSNPGGVTATGPGSGIVVNGLTNGTAYNFFVTATNSQGTGLRSVFSNTVTPMAVQAITFTNPNTQIFGTSPALAATASSTLPVTFTSTTPAVCTITTDGVLTFTGVGNCTIDADQAGDGADNPAAQVEQTFTVDQADQAIIFGALPATILGAAPFTVSATGGASGNAVTFTSVNPSVCTTGGANGATVTLVGPGTCTLAANQAGTANYNAAPTVTQSFGVSVIAQAIAFAALPGRTFGDAAFIVSASGGASGNLVILTSLTPTVCTAAGANIASVTLVAAGTCTIAADQAGNSNYAAAARVSRSFTVAPAAQAITFAALPGRTVGDAAFAVGATGGLSGNPVTFASMTPAVCTTGGASGATVSPVAAGSCAIAANQAGNANYNAAPQVMQTFAVHAVVSVSFTGPSATGSGAVTASFTGGGAGCGYSAPQFIPLTGNAASPPAGSTPAGITFPHGLFTFSTTGCTPGSTLDFTITYPAALPSGVQYWKYGPTPANATPHWYVIPANVSGGTMTFSITDGGLGDDDLTANGTVVDQGGPGAPGGGAGAISQVPTLSEWALALLALLMLGFGVLRMPGGASRRG